MKPKWKIAAATAMGLIACFWDIPVVVESIRFVRGSVRFQQLPFQLRPFSPVVAAFGWLQHPDNLFVTDRIWFVSDQIINNRLDLARAVEQRVPGEPLVMFVLHYPTQSPPWSESVLVEPTRPTPAAYLNAALFGIFFPVLCLILAYASIVWAAESWRLLIALGLLLSFSQLASLSPIDLYAWSSWIAIPALLIHYLAVWTIPLQSFLFLRAFRHGTPRLGGPGWLCVAALGVLAAIMSFGGVAEAVSYRLSAVLVPFGTTLTWLATSVVFISIAVTFVFFALVSSRSFATPARFSHQYMKWAILAAFTPMLVVFGPSCLGLARGFDPMKSLAPFQ